MPLRELTPYVSKDLARFISAVDDYLNAFVARRVQIVDLAQTASLVLGGEPEASPSFNNVRFTVVVAPLPDSGESECWRKRGRLTAHRRSLS